MPTPNSETPARTPCEPTLDVRGDLIENHWVIVRDAAAQHADLADQLPDVIVPLALWQADGVALLARKRRVGAWLNSDEEPLDLAASIASLSLIAVHFPAFSDGRGLSVAVLLRTRLKYRGDLRAIGDVRQDQLSYMRRCGFTTFTPAHDANIAELRNGLVVMSDYYQASVLEPTPLFRRRAARSA